MEFLAHETAHSSFWIANQKKEEEAAKDILAEFSFGIVLPLFSILLDRYYTGSVYISYYVVRKLPIVKWGHNGV